MKNTNISTNQWEQHAKNIDISKNAMLIESNFSCLGSTKRKHSLSDKITEENNATEDSINTSLVLFNKSAMLQIRAVRSQARNYIKDNTLPWGKSGERLLPARMFNSFSERITELKVSYETAVTKFIENFPIFMDQNKERLGKLFDSSDYPTPESLQEYFAFNVTFLPVPIENDFRVEVISEAVQKQIKSGISDMVTQKVGDANIHLLERMLKKVKHLSERLSSDDGHFKDSSINAINEIAKVVKELNFTESKEITELADNLLELGKVKPSEIRKDDHKKFDVVKKANDLVSKIEGII